MSEAYDELAECGKVGAKLGFSSSETYLDVTTPAWLWFRNPHTNTLVKFGINPTTSVVETLSVSMTLGKNYINFDLFRAEAETKYASASQNIKFQLDSNMQGLKSLVGDLIKSGQIADFVEQLESVICWKISIDDDNNLLVCFDSGELNWFPLEQFSEPEEINLQQ